MKGIFFAVVGKSGVGKDTILAQANLMLNNSVNFYFPRRFITRPAANSGENHISVSPANFKNMMNEGEFCLWWQAHGLYYGLSSEITDKLRAGYNVLANISREVVAEAAVKFDKAQIIEIIAEPETLKKRLVDRGRESPQEVLVRYTREVDNLWHGSLRVFKISNDGSPEIATQKFVEKILKLSGETFEQA